MNFKPGLLEITGYNDWFDGAVGPVKYLSPKHKMSEINKSKYGLYFLIPPEVMVSASAEYIPSELTHSNDTFYTWKRSSNGEITLVVQFVNYNIDLANYYFGALQFLRTCTKGHLGKSKHAGAPPPILRLSLYGESVYKNLPVVVASVATNIGNAETDFIETEYGTVPIKAAITIKLLPMQNPYDAITNANIDDYAKGTNRIEGYY